MKLAYRKGYSKVKTHIKRNTSRGITYLRIMSFDRGFRIDLTPEQVVELAKQLPSKEKRALAEAFEREGR